MLTRWNGEVVEALARGAREALTAWGVRDIDELYVPGAFEVPLACEQIARARSHHGAVALGAVIRGDTPHFEFVAGECARGIQDVSLRHAFPIGFGVLTVNTDAQAAERSQPGPGNKGHEAALAMLEMLRLGRSLNPTRRRA